MGWSIGYDPNWGRDIGYGVPAYCDHPHCDTTIDRGLSFVCGGEPYGGEHGCGLYFCSAHLWYSSDRRDGVQLCARCLASKPPYKRIKPEHPEWMQHVLTDASWAAWRENNPLKVVCYQAALGGKQIARPVVSVLPHNDLQDNSNRRA